MTTTVTIDGGHLACYVGADGNWHTARDARGQYIICETETLAQSVARYRRRRLRRWR
jgi:hypothetical protein